MPSQETGHTKNVANFKSLVLFCTGYGSKYNPTQDILKLANLQGVLDSSISAMAVCATTETAFGNAVDARKNVFNNLKPLATRVVNAFAASGVEDNEVDSAKSINNKIQGKRASPKEAPKKAEDGTEIPSTSNSSSQQGFDNQVKNFNALVELVSSKPLYMPNETDLAVNSLKTYLAALDASNTNVKNTYTDWSNDRIKRDTVMYAAKTGMIEIARGVKKYLKSVFKPTSAEFKQVSGLRFKEYK